MRLLGLILLVGQLAYAAGTVTVTRQGMFNKGARQGELVQVSWTADASDGSVPDTEITVCGWFVKLVTNPGATAPTDNYDITLGDPNDNALDALRSAGLNRDTANTEQSIGLLYDSGATGYVPVWVCGPYTFNLDNNSVNSATGVARFYFMDHL